MTARQISTALLCIGAIALGATQYLGSPWPGVVLSCLSMLSWAFEAWLARGDLVETDRRVDALVTLVNDMQKSFEEQGQQINSLRNSVSLRGTLGG